MTTLNLQVAASTDDAWQNAAGTVDTTAAIIGTLSTGNMWAGFRFNNVTVPQGATINTATLQLYLNTTANDDLVADFYCEAADDAGTFTTGASNISSRSRTTAKASVSATAIGVGWYSVTGLAAAVEEVTDRAGWASGNDLAIILDALAGISFQCRTWDFDTSLAAKLDIDYTAASAGQPTIARGRLVPGMGRPHGRQGW